MPCAFAEAWAGVKTLQKAHGGEGKERAPGQIHSAHDGDGAGGRLAGVNTRGAPRRIRPRARRRGAGMPVSQCGSSPGTHPPQSRPLAAALSASRSGHAPRPALDATPAPRPRARPPRRRGGGGAPPASSRRRRAPRRRRGLAVAPPPARSPRRREPRPGRRVAPVLLRGQRVPRGVAPPRGSAPPAGPRAAGARRRRASRPPAARVRRASNATGE